MRMESKLSLALVVLACCALGSSTVVSAQTLEQLQQENRMLRARIQTLQQQMGIQSDDGTFVFVDDEHDHDHDHEHDHDHNGHDHHQFDDHAHDDHGHGKGDYCEPHFDFCLPFEEHHGGHGHCDLCDCGACIGGGGSGDGHGHGHAHGPAYHHSIDGYPLLHAPRTEFFFVERHVHFVLADIRGADGGTVDEFEFEAEITYALNDRLVLIGALPVIHLDPDGAPSTSGVGDMEFGMRFMAFNGPRDGLLFGLNVVAPTGDPDRDLGGDTLLLPSANWVHDFGCGTYMFNVVTWETPIDVADPEDLFLYDFVLLHTFTETCDASLFRYLTPVLEINTETVINGAARGQTVVDMTLGATWVVGEGNEVSVGWSFPISGDQNFDDQFVFNFIRHL